MKTTSSAAVSVLTCLAMFTQAHAQIGADSPQGTKPLAQVGDPIASDSDTLLNVITNLVAGVGEFGINLHVESLTLNLNGYALVGLHNSLGSPNAEQVIVGADGSANSSVATQTVARLEPQPGSSPADAKAGGFTLSNTNVLAAVSNLLSAAKVSGLGFHIGRVTLNLNGYAMVGATNALDGLTARQRLTNSPAVQGTSLQAGSPNSRIETGSSAAVRANSIGDVTLNLTGTAALALPTSAPKAQPPAPPSP